jgi:hypothetical protein
LLARPGSQIRDSFGGQRVAAHTLSQQADRAVLHSRLAIDDDSQTSHGGDGDHPSSKPIDDVDPRRNHASDGSRAQYLVGSALVVVVTLVGWITFIKSLLFLFLPPEMEAGIFLGQLHYQQLFYLYEAFSLVLGVYLTYGGFKSRPH